ncbi:HAD family hydrolase [Calothrix sp. UHCC 0171]|uniref:HAD family hydrolase n=1 Tax=Calothrix sp. UHCC 0171 TaxID=3110245 RepID=UPI002B21BC85|nr:HAD family hydrolase [Calothrix sp. UHCC 0171]MEA5573632.1 HAD family hydrolase [Calothrix sp. UHCC 0171]
MTAIIPTILASDFDGVICDGMVEYFEVAWRTYCQIWTPKKQIPSDALASKFYSLRPVIETGWEMPVLIKAVVDEIPEEKIFKDWLNITQKILAGYNLKSSEIAFTLDKIRDEWIASDLEDWMSLHRFYPGVVDRIRNILASGTQLYIVTTKEGRFAQKLLQKEGIELPREVIFGKEAKRPKYEILRELKQKAGGSQVSMWFIEDRLNTLQLVKQQSDLEDVQLFLADWGYNTPSERLVAHNEPRISLLSLGQYVQDFSKWG